MRFLRVFALFCGLTMLIAGCASGPAELGKAEETLTAKIAEDAGYREYALSIIGDSTAAYASAARVDAIQNGGRKGALSAIPMLDLSNEAERAALMQAYEGRGSVKLQAATRLAAEGDSAAIEWLAGQMGQGGTVLPATAMNVLAGTEHEEDVKIAARGLIWSKDLSIRNEGYTILGQIEKPWAVDQLLEGLGKEFGEERVVPIVSLGQRGDSRAVEPIAKWVKTQGLVRASLESLAQLGDASVLDRVTPMLEHEEPIVRAYAAAAAWRLGDGESAKSVYATLVEDEAVEVRQQAAIELANIEADEATAWLVALSEDAEPAVRVDAMRGLLTRADKVGAEVFRKGAADDNYEVATLAMAGLANTGTAEDAAGLAAQLEDPNPYTAISAAHAIQEIHARLGAGSH